MSVEYGGHVLQHPAAARSFDAHPEYFPAGDDGVRDGARQSVRVESRGASHSCARARSRYVRDNPENALLHIWGADVWRGAWCRCAAMPRAVAADSVYEDRQRDRGGAAPRSRRRRRSPISPITTRSSRIPRCGRSTNVWFEWAPRERCYSHAIDDPACDDQSALPRVAEALHRYLRRARPRLRVLRRRDPVRRDGLRDALDHRVAISAHTSRLGIESISYLTFGAYSVLAYPVNLEAFVRGHALARLRSRREPWMIPRPAVIRNARRDGSPRIARSSARRSDASTMPT